MKYSAAGIRGRTLIVNLPGSEKAARENLSAVAEALCHGMDMLASGGSANCAGTEKAKRREAPSLDAWLKEAKAAPEAAQCGMFLFHNGTVRRTAKAMVRENTEGTAPVSGMYFSYDAEKVDAAIKKTRAMPGIYYVRVWLNGRRHNAGARRRRYPPARDRRAAKPCGRDKAALRRRKRNILTKHRRRNMSFSRKKHFIRFF